MVLLQNLLFIASFTLGLTSPTPQDLTADTLSLSTEELFLQGKLIPNYPSKPPKCKSPGKRKAWQALTRAERKSYIAAEKCLQSKPSKAKLEAAKSRFDDLVKAHQIPALAVHGSGNFLPFHRAFVNAHELLLRTECGYKGYQPYWAEEVDIGKIFQSELLLADKEVGFGGTGKAPDWCVNDGAFKDYVLTTGPGFNNTRHCLKRNIQNNPTWGAGAPYTEHCKKMENFIDFSRCTEESGPHIGYHAAIGIELNNPVSSPGDPLFYLHHTWIDKLWYDWQRVSPHTRLTDIGGRKEGFMPGFGGAPLPGFRTPGGLPAEELFPPFGIPIFPLPEEFTWPKLFEGFNNTWTPTPDPVADADPVKLTDVLKMYGTVGDVKIGDVMDTKGGYLCYEYVEYKKGRK